MMRSVNKSDLPADGVVHMPVAEASLDATLREGVSAGAFFTILPLAFTTMEQARDHGEGKSIVAIDTALCPDTGAWRINDDIPGQMVVWGSIPASAFSADPACEAGALRP